MQIMLLNILIFEIGEILKYITHYDTFNLEVSFFYKKKVGRTLLYEVSPYDGFFLVCKRFVIPELLYYV